MNIKIVLFLLTIATYGKAQNTAILKHNLNRTVTLDIKQEPISEVLAEISTAGKFYFSYGGSSFNPDSIVTIKVTNKAVKDILNQLFNGKVDYKENGDHIILRYAANRLTIEPENITTAENLYIITGYVKDTQTGLKVKQASVYEKRLLQSDLTDNDGYFKLRFKGPNTEVILTASKDNYRDTSLVFLSDIKIRPEGYKDPDEEQSGSFFSSVENTGIGRFFVSSRQKIQSLNISGFFANSPFQASLTPGLSSHGIIGSQVVNKVSLNVFGGYTAGVNGIEVAGLFNVTRGNVYTFQTAGLFNTVGGSVHGLQVAGLLNDVRSGLKGVQVAGLFNNVKETVEGVQVAGLGNVAFKSIYGTQVGGLVNLSPQDIEGTQIAGLSNFALKTINGIQISGLLNYAANMKGVQIGLINISDRNSGYSIGLINYVHHGYHKISISSNETIQINAALKTGNANLYNILMIGKSFGHNKKVDAFGLGFGHDFIRSDKVSVAAELTAQCLYLGNWDYANILSRIQTHLQLQLVKGFTVFGGPAYSIYSSDAPSGSSGKGYKQKISPDKYQNINHNTKGWLGWNIGITMM